MRPILKGTLNHSEFFVLRDSTTGLGKTGLAFGDITGSYTRQRAARTAITMATLASASAAFSSGGFVEVDATNEPGLYRLDVPDAAFATGVDQVVVAVKATGIITEYKELRLVDVNDQDGVRFGLTTLPNAAAGATGGLDCTVAFGGTAGAGSATTITLTGAVATDGYYVGQTITLVGGTGAGQARDIVAYVGSTKVATVDQAWITNPDNTTVYQVTGRRRASAPSVAMGYVAAASGNLVTLQTALGANNVINGCSITILAGTGQGQTRGILLYTDSTKVATVDKPWGVAPDTTSLYVVHGPLTPQQAVVTAGIAAAGAATTITLAATASASNTAYPEDYVQIVGGTGVGQVRSITAYNGTTKVATVNAAWDVNPDNTSIYIVGLGNRPATNGVGAISTVTALSAAEETAIAAAVLAATVAELTQAQPPTTPTVAQALALLYMDLRNGGTTASGTETVLNNAGTVIAKRTYTDDGTVLTVNKMVSGP